MGYISCICLIVTWMFHCLVKLPMGWLGLYYHYTQGKRIKTVELYVIMVHNPVKLTLPMNQQANKTIIYHRLFHGFCSTYRGEWGSVLVTVSMFLVVAVFSWYLAIGDGDAMRSVGWGWPAPETSQTYTTKNDILYILRISKYNLIRLIDRLIDWLLDWLVGFRGIYWLVSVCSWNSLNISIVVGTSPAVQSPATC